MKGRSAVPVVAAALLRGSRVLLAQRPDGKHLAGKWEFPGGKVDAGESPEAALIRELREELGCEVESLRPLPHFVHHYETISIELIPFTARLAPGSPEPHAKEHASVRWVEITELADCDLAEADWPIVDALVP